MKAIETTGTIQNNNQLVLDTPVQNHNQEKVKLIILLNEDDDITDTDWMKSASKNPELNFLHDPIEDIYTNEDGKAFHKG